jgi:hypothetical protein
VSGWTKWFWWLAIWWFLIIQAAEQTTAPKSEAALYGLNTLMILISLGSIGMYTIGIIVKDTLEDKNGK